MPTPDTAPADTEATLGTPPSRLMRYERLAEPAMLLLAVGSLPLLLVEQTYWYAAAAGHLIVVVFGVDLAVRVALTDEPKLRYLRYRWHDVMIVVLSVIPLARPLRMFRALRVLRGVRVFLLLHKALDATSRMWVEVHGKRLIVSCAVLAAVSLWVVHSVETDAGGSIDSMGTTLWWAVTTVTTVGYGDTSPITNEGRVAAAVMMVTGIALFGLLIANLSSLFLKYDALLEYRQIAEMLGSSQCRACGHIPAGDASDGPAAVVPARRTDVLEAQPQ